MSAEEEEYQEKSEAQLYNLSDDAMEEQFQLAKDEQARLAAEEVVEEPEEEITEEEVVEDEEIEDLEQHDEEIEETEEDELDEASDTDDTIEVNDSDKTDDTQDKADDDTDDTEEKDTEEVDKPEEVTPEAKVEEVKADVAISKYKIKANGTELELTNEELIKLAPKALDYTKKMQEIAPWRKTISALVDNELTESDVNLMIDVMKGDKEALATVLKTHGIEADDMHDVEADKYAPKNYGRTEQQLAIDDVLMNIKGDVEYTKTESVVDGQWDGKSRKQMAEDPRMIEGLHVDVKSGVFDKVNPIALKLKALDNGRKSDLDYYMQAGQEFYAGENANAMQAQAAELKQQEELALSEKVEAEKAQLAKDQAEVAKVKAEQTKQKTIKKAANSRKAAATTKKAAGTRNVIDYLDENDEAYDEWYKKLNDSL